jgi:2,5-diamino-6-(ribosylamino)-4(3H)-pyrimidinone 5'-phosphate reductase
LGSRPGTKHAPVEIYMQPAPTIVRAHGVTADASRAPVSLVYQSARNAYRSRHSSLDGDRAVRDDARPGQAQMEALMDQQHPQDAIKPDYTALEFPDPPADRPYVLVNMVMSLDGRVVVEGNERGLGSPADQRLMRELRVHADVVMNGAGTLRASGTSSRTGDPALDQLRAANGRPNPAIAAVLTASGDLPLDRLFFTARDFRAIVYVAEATPEPRRRALEATGREIVTLPSDAPLQAMLRHMRQELDARVLLVEGGPTLNGGLLDAGMIDECFITLAGRVVNGRDTRGAFRSERPPTQDAIRQLRLVSSVTNPATSELYLRYRLLP